MKSNKLVLKRRLEKILNDVKKINSEYLSTLDEI